MSPFTWPLLCSGESALCLRWIRGWRRVSVLSPQPSDYRAGQLIETQVPPGRAGAATARSDGSGLPGVLVLPFISILAAQGTRGIDYQTPAADSEQNMASLNSCGVGREAICSERWPQRRIRSLLYIHAYVIQPVRRLLGR